MKQYFIEYPRNFANEYTVFFAETEEAQEKAHNKCLLHAGNPNSTFNRITRKEAIKKSPQAIFDIMTEKPYTYDGKRIED